MVSSCTAPSRRSSPGTPARRSGAPRSPCARSTSRRASSARSDSGTAPHGRGVWAARSRHDRDLRAQTSGAMLARVERGLLTGLAVFRWAAWAWMALVLLLNREDLERPWLALALVGLALA